MVAKDRRGNTKNRRLKGCLAAPFVILGLTVGFFLYIIAYGAVVAGIILIVVTILEWFGVDIPRYTAPDWFGQHGK